MAVRLGDALAFMAGMPDDAFDHVITDPPYDEHTHAKSRRGCTGYVEPTRPGAQRAQFNRNRDLGFEPMTVVERTKAAAEFARLARRWVLVFSSHEDSMKWRVALEEAGLQYVRTMVWIKKGAAPQFTGDRPAIGHECIVVAHRPGKKRWNGGGKHGVYQVPIVLNRGPNSEQRVHTTQKPLALMAALVRDFTDHGDSVLDPYCGSGTTLVACRQSGRRATGIEQDRSYVDIARARLADAREQLEIGGGA